MYKIVGADNREYGPVTQEEILQWIAAGRANAQTIARLGEGAWKPLGTFDEFKAALNVPLTGAAPAGGWSTYPSTNTGRRANAPAIAGLGCGILGLGCCCCPFLPFIFSLLAIVFGAVGLSQIKARPNAFSTDATLAKIAIGLGIAGLLFNVVMQMVGAGMSTNLEKHLKDVWR